MAYDLRRKILDWEQALRGPLQAWGWIFLTIIVVACLAIIVAETKVWPWLFRGAQIVLVGLSTALFTRFLGGMGMFRDAISDVLGEDRWLDRRKDLDDLWRRITRRIFLPGFREDAPDAQRLLAALNETMNNVVHQPAQQVNYYQRDMKRRIHVGWADEAQRVVEVTEYLETTIIPFDAEVGCLHELRFTPTSGESMDSYGLRLRDVTVDGKVLDLNLLAPTVRGDAHIYRLNLRGRESFRFTRTIINQQRLDDDPILIALAGRGVVWGMNVIIDAAPNLRINFEEAGVDGAFRPVGERGGSRQEWETESALFPNQGFQIVMAQTSAGRQVPTAAPKMGGA